MNQIESSSRGRILDSAITLFAEKGYTETSMKNIAKASGIQASSIYSHFKSKKDILDHIINLYASLTATNLPVVTDEFIKTNDAATTLKAIFFRFEEDSSLMYRRVLKIFMQEQYRIDEIREFMKTAYIDGVYAIIKTVLDKLAGYGKISADVNTELFAEILHSVNIKSTVTSCHYINEPVRFDDRWEEALELVIELIVNQ